MVYCIVVITHLKLIFQVVSDLPHVCTILVNVVNDKLSGLAQTSYHTSVLSTARTKTMNQIQYITLM